MGEFLHVFSILDQQVAEKPAISAACDVLTRR
jgi:hypothetical protein